MRYSNYEGRIQWVDALKFLGILAIYLGHSVIAKDILFFIYLYHVPLFFFVSGFFVTRNREQSFLKSIWKKVKSLILPYIFFALISTFLYYLHFGYSFIELISVLKPYLFGIRNQLTDVALWFLPCLFMVFLIFEILYRTIKKIWIILIISIVFILFGGFFLPKEPSWFFNLDTALLNLFYFVLGSLFFQKYDFKVSELRKNKKIILVGVSVFSVIITMLIFIFQLDYILQITDFSIVGQRAVLVLLSLVVIYSNIILAHIISKIKLLNYVGSKSLYLCGNGQIAFVILADLLAVFGIKIAFDNLLSGILFMIFFMVFSTFTVIKIEEKLFGKLFK